MSWRKWALLAGAALLFFPTFTLGGLTEQQLAELLRGRARDYRTQTRELLTGVRENLSILAPVVPEAGFDSAVDQISVVGFNAMAQYGSARGGYLTLVRNDIQSVQVDPSDPSYLRGLPSCSSRAAEAYLWGDPIEFSKSVQMSIARQRLSVERFNAIEDRFDRFRANVSVQYFPNPRDEIVFTGSPSFTPRLEIGGITGASFRFPEENDARTSACLFGWAPPSTMVDVTATGLGGPYNNSDTSDSNGGWHVCLTGLKHGYYQFTADDGTNTDVKEQGFLLPLSF
jgi:hypothetical protein